jgi:error-prone DNA polymerase
LIGGFRSAAAGAIAAARASGPFRSLSDLARRARLGRSVLEALADADAFGSLALDRREALWHALGQDRSPQASPLFAGVDDDEPPVTLPVLNPFDQVVADYQTTGLSLKGHPMAFYRGQLDRLRVTPADQLAKLTHGRRVTVAGIVLLRQRPSTAKGITFVTLEDESGCANLVVRQTTWDRFFRVARRSPAWVVHGTLESKDNVVHVLADRLEDLSVRLGELRTRSRDFR